MTTYVVNISNLNASMRSLDKRVIDFSPMQFQVSSYAFHPTCNHLENLQGNVQLKADDHYGYNSTSITLDHLFLLHKEWGGLTFPSTAILKIIKVGEVIFMRRVIENEKGITSERNLVLKIQSGILVQIGTDIFSNIGGHYADHTTGEGDHLTFLLRIIVAKYVSIRLKSYGKDYTQMVAHKNIPSKRHLLTKSVIFSGQ